MRNVSTHYRDHDCVGLVKKRKKGEDEKKKEIKKAEREKKERKKRTTKCKCLIVSIGDQKTAFGD